MAGSWDKPLESGLRDNFDATVVKSRFATDARYMSGTRTVLIWTLEGTGEDGAAFEDEKFLSIGDKWESLDGGASVRHATGKDRNFNRSSIYGKIIDRALNDFAIGDVLAARGTQYEAKVWEGLRFHFVTEEVSYGANIEAKQALLPSAYLGEAGAPGAAPAAAPAAAAQAPAAAPAANGGVRTTALAVAKGLVAAGKTSADFIDAAMSIDGLTSDANVLSEVVEGSIWAEVGGQ